MDLTLTAAELRVRQHRGVRTEPSAGPQTAFPPCFSLVSWVVVSMSETALRPHLEPDLLIVSDASKMHLQALGGF